MHTRFCFRRGIGSWLGIAAGLGIAGSLGALGLTDPPTRVPPPDLGSTAIACNASEPGERLLVAGQVVDFKGQPIARATVTLYNTEATGLTTRPILPRACHGSRRRCTRIVRGGSKFSL